MSRPQRTTCPACQGAGTKTEIVGGRVKVVACPNCKGNGTVEK